MSETETHRNKVALTAALVVALIALAGVGYAAAHSFEGRTVSGTQTMDTDFVTVTLDNAAYGSTTVENTKAHVIWNTVTIWKENAAVKEYDFKEADTITYNVTIDKSALEDGQTLSLAVTLANAFSSPGLKMTCSFNGATAVDVSSTTVLSSQNVTDLNSFTLAFTVVENGTAGTTSGYITETPDTSVTIPAVTIVVTGNQAAAA